MVEFVPTYREDTEDTEPVAELSMTVPLTAADLVALLWLFLDWAHPEGFGAALAALSDSAVPEVLVDRSVDEIVRVRDEVIPRVEWAREEPYFGVLLALRRRVCARYGHEAAREPLSGSRAVSG